MILVILKIHSELANKTNDILLTAIISGSKGVDHLTVDDRRDSSPFDRSAQANGRHSPARLPPPVVEIQPIRMEKKPMGSPFRAFGKGKKADKDKTSSDAQENRINEVRFLARCPPTQQPSHGRR